MEQHLIMNKSWTNLEHRVDWEGQIVPKYAQKADPQMGRKAI